MVTTMQRPSSFSSLPWQDLDAAIGGELFLPDNPRYEEARHVWNGMIERHPAAIARCKTVDDVVRAVDFARVVKVKPGEEHPNLQRWRAAMALRPAMAL